MTTAWTIAGLLVIVGAIFLASRHPSWEPLFHWLPVPLWCYALPMGAVTLGWLPRAASTYHALTEIILPIALVLLLVGIDVAAVCRAGSRALIAMIAGVVGVMIGAPVGAWLLQAQLPPEAWKGAGALAATWTGGTMNLLALRSLLVIPDAAFAPLIVVDAVVAYSWMALLVAISAFRDPINRWLHAQDAERDAIGPSFLTTDTSRDRRGARVGCVLLAVALWGGARVLAAHLPTTLFINSSSGWTVLLVTSATLGLSLVSAVRRLGAGSETLGYPCLYLVLAATGAQAHLAALSSAPGWLLVGVITAAVHGSFLVAVGRACRIPLGTLATASQANIGGVVSAPLVGAVYRQSLAPVGLLLAMAANALGTYLGWISALVCRWMVGG